MKKLSARCVPRLLTVDQKQKRVDDFQVVGLALKQRNRAKFFRRSVTMDGTWIYYYSLESNRKSVEWVESHESRTKNSARWESYGLYFFGCAQHLHRLHTERSNSRRFGRRRLLSSVIGHYEW